MKAFQATPLVWLVSREREREREGVREEEEEEDIDQFRVRLGMMCASIRGR
jgi:hypothetical protein